MSLTCVKVGVSYPVDIARGVKVELLVDTGAIFTTVPKEVLANLRINPAEKRRLLSSEGKFLKQKQA